MRKDWIEVELGDVTNSIQYGYTESSSIKPIGPKFLRITDIQENNVVWDDVPYCKIDDEKLGKYLLEKGDLLFARTGATVGKSFLIKTEIPNAVFASYLIRVRVQDIILNDYFLSFFFNSPFYWQQITEGQVGIGQPNVNGTKLGKLQIPIPPLPEQRAIVAKIEQLFSELDNGIANFKTAQEQLKVYRQAVLKKAFEGEFTKEWREKQTNLLTAEELLQQIKTERENHYQKQLKDLKQAVKDWETNGKEGKKPSGISKPKTLPSVNQEEIETYGTLDENWEWSRFCNITYKIGDIDHKMPKFFEGGLPYLSTGNLKKDGSIDFANAKTISREDFNRLALKIKPEKGDIIFPRYGTIGRNILINFNKEFLVSYSCAIIKNITSFLDEKYVYYYSLSPVIQREIKRYTVETTQANIGIASIENFVFPLCSKEEQHQIVQEIESRLSVCDKIEETLKESLAKAEALRQSILKKAFEGKLLSEQEIEACKKESDWEPAENLLAKIKKEKEKNLQVKSGKKKTKTK